MPKSMMLYPVLPLLVAASLSVAETVAVLLLGQADGLGGSWIDLVSKVGFPMALCCALLYCLWKAASTFYEEIVKPVAMDHRAFLKTTSEVLQKQAASIDGLRAGQDETNRTLHQMCRGQESDRQGK